MNIKLRRIFGRITKAVFVHYSYCKCCLCTWNTVKEHITHYGIYTRDKGGGGMFPLCEHCWKRLKPKERIPYYKQTFLMWQVDGPHHENAWPEIEWAVLNEGSEEWRKKCYPIVRM